MQLKICEGLGSKHNEIEQRPADESWRVKDEQVNGLMGRED